MHVHRVLWTVGVLMAELSVLVRSECTAEEEDISPVSVSLSQREMMCIVAKVN